MERKRFLKLPKLRFRYRFLLYCLTILFVVLAMLSVVFHCFSEVIEIVCYALAAVTIFPGSCYLAVDIRYGVQNVIKPQLAANPYAVKVAADYRLRTVLFAVPGLTGNVIFAIFNGAVGILSHSAWFGSLSAYYILLSVMRIGAVRQEHKISTYLRDEERFQKEIKVYRKNSWLFILMSVVLGGMVILLEASAGGKSYPGFTIYAVAFYTFYRIIMSVVHLVKTKKQHSPLLMIIRKIGYADACVSLLTLQTAMFASFSGEAYFEKTMNGVTGSVVCLMVLGMGIQGVCVSNRKN